ncbi:uncharacterized protein Pyn_19863 [Prunus yedoensis var. nudiflora]|uniref:Plastocyanin-like domain-containing protein n=1 Tax=Prunus yedoensis var. nudiflora TaxID=2094558 RepID=A0A314ZPB0_PRUYE|nr:uncharacterized protein Pyn_19863 [Prunus yedoensis var. nudiflora]
MDASVLRAVVLMSMLVLSIAQADINPSCTNAVPNDNPLDQVGDVYPCSNTNQVVPNGPYYLLWFKMCDKVPDEPNMPWHVHDQMQT